MDHTLLHLKEHMRLHFAGKPSIAPAAGVLVWQWFIALCRTRTGNGWGPNPISFSEIEAYARLYRWPLEPRHVDMILALDREWMNHARGGSPGAAPVHSQPMTADAFDAVFS